MFLPLIVAIASVTAATATVPTVLRIRNADGSVVRVPLPNDDLGSTLSSILTSAGVNLDADDAAGLKCQVGAPGRSSSATLDVSPSGADGRRTAMDLGLRHGSMITMLPPPTSRKDVDDGDGSTDGSRNEEGSGGRFDPFPELAKSTSYSGISLRARSRSRGISRGMTYSDISRIREAMHVVEPQPKGVLTRVYVCQVAAARFQKHCIVNIPKEKQKKSTSRKKRKEEGIAKVENRVALLFGTINRERVDQSRKKAKTSLSSTTEEDEICDVAKVHAVWEPPLQKPTLNGRHYDEDCLLMAYRGDAGSNPQTETTTDRAIRVAASLGLYPLGWMFSYTDEDRHEDGDALPVHGRDAVVGAKLQIETMKLRGRAEGKKFVTLALDGRIGATEAFQLSDVCVQMVAENVLLPPMVEGTLPSSRFITMKDPVVVLGEETKKIDSVLLLVNMAMLSHVGLYSGGTDAPIGGNVKRGSGALLVKTRKRILASLEQGDCALKELCDFDILLALDLLVGREESEKLCSLVRKYARGQKKGTALDDHLRVVLQSVLGG